MPALIPAVAGCQHHQTVIPDCFTSIPHPYPPFCPHPQVLTAWVQAAYSSPADLPARRAVLAAMALPAARRHGPQLAHLAAAMARAGLRRAAVAVGARGVAPSALKLSHLMATAYHGAPVPPVGQPWYAGGWGDARERAERALPAMHGCGVLVMTMPCRDVPQWSASLVT